MQSFHKNRTHNIKSQYCLLLDGVNERININDALTPLATTTVGTWSCWVNPVDATPAANDMLISFGAGDTTDLLRIVLTTTGVFSGAVTNNNITQWALNTNSAVFSDNTWTHVAVVQDGVSPVLYINGVAVAQTFATSTDKTQWFNNLVLNNGRLGCRFWAVAEGDGALPFNGSIDEVALFNTNLTAAQVLEIYKGGSRINLNAHSKAANLAGYFRMSDPDATFSTNWSIPDDSVNNNAGTSVNMEATDISTGIIGF